MRFNWNRKKLGAWDKRWKNWAIGNCHVRDAWYRKTNGGNFPVRQIAQSCLLHTAENQISDNNRLGFLLYILPWNNKKKHTDVWNWRSFMKKKGGEQSYKCSQNTGIKFWTGCRHNARMCTTRSTMEPGTEPQAVPLPGFPRPPRTTSHGRLRGITQDGEASGKANQKGESSSYGRDRRK